MKVIVEDAAQLSDGSDDGHLHGAASAVPRRKIEIAYISDKPKRHISFSKRKAGIFKKAHELATLTGTQVLLLIVSETGLVYTYTTPKLQPLVTAKEGQYLIQTCLTSTSSVSSVSDEPLTPPSAPESDSAVINSAHSMSSLTLAAHSGAALSGIPALTVSPSDMMTPQAQYCQPNPRALKKRRTAENLKAAAQGRIDSDASVPHRPTQLAALAKDAYDLAQQVPVLANLMNAYQMHDQADRDRRTQPNAGVAFSLSHLMLSIQTRSSAADLTGTLDPQYAGVDTLDAILTDFVQRYLPGTFGHQPSDSSIDSITNDIRMWIRWLFAHQWIDAGHCSSLLRRIGPATPRRIASNSRLRRAANPSNADAPKSARSPAHTAIQAYANWVQTAYLPELFSDASMHGILKVCALSKTFVVLETTDAGALSTHTMPDSALLKLRLPPAATALLQLGDVLSLRAQRLLGDPDVAHWVPNACDDHKPPSADSDASPVLPPAHVLHAQMQSAQEADDQLAFADAFALWQKVMRIDKMLAQGELPTDGYGEAALPPIPAPAIYLDQAALSPETMSTPSLRDDADADDPLWVLE